MAMFDPFYGISRGGVVVAKWMNRLLLVAEFLLLCLYGFVLFSYTFSRPIFLIPFALASFAVLRMANRIIRGVWNIFISIVYGTNDPVEIGKTLDKRDVGRQNRREKRSLAKVKREQKKINRLIERKKREEIANFRIIP